MSRTLVFRNRQRARRIDTALLRQVTLDVLIEKLRIQDFELAVHLVAAPEMARVNKTFLDHEGSTDVITFDHSDETASGRHDKSRKEQSQPEPMIHGEIFLCLDDAIAQAKQFRTTWQSEVTRYVIHGLLHLCGHDDLQPAARRIMKREENQLLKETARMFALAKLEKPDSKRGTNSSGRIPRRSAR